MEEYTISLVAYQLDKKSIKFNTEPIIYYTHSDEEYDRTPTGESKLGYKDVLELMQIKLELRQQYAKEQQLYLE